MKRKISGLAALCLSLLLSIYTSSLFAQAEKVLVGDEVILTASGAESPVQWQQSSDGASWDNIDGATTLNYQFTAVGSSGDLFYYRAAIENNACGESQLFYSSEIQYQIIETSDELQTGDSFRGGKYLISLGGNKRIAAAVDDHEGIRWGCISQNIYTQYDDGVANTESILDNCGERPIAASVCGDSEISGYQDWYLPSDDEVHWMAQNKEQIGNFSTTYYWTSTAAGSGSQNIRAWSWHFNLNLNYVRNRNETDKVRCMRSFFESDTTRSIAIFENIPTPATIETQPEGTVVCAQSAATLSIVVESNTPVDYQWYFNGNLLEGANESSLTIENALLANQGSYYCEITNQCGTIVSNEAEILVIELEVQAGTDSEFCPGTAVQLNGSATSNHPTESGDLIYEWLPVDGLSDPTILNPVAEPDRDILYTLTVTDQLTCQAQSSIQLTMLDYPAINTQPEAQNLCPGEEATLTVVASGSAPLSYQWMKNGEIITDATDNTFSLPTVQENDEGMYSCVVSNSCGSVESEGAMISVSGLPAINSQLVSDTICLGDDAELTVAATGTEPLSYQWKKDGEILENATEANLVITSAELNDEGIYLCEISNLCATIISEEAVLNIVNLTVDAGPDDTWCISDDPYQIDASALLNHPEISGSFVWSWSPSEGLSDPEISDPLVSPTETTTYQVTVSDEVGCLASDSFTLNAIQGITIVDQPAPLNVCNNGTATFGVDATAEGEISWQWKKDGQIIPDAVTSELTIENVAPEDAGLYSCELTHTCGVVNSAEVELKIIELTVDAGIDQTICLGSETALLANAESNDPDVSGDISWVWEPSENLSDASINNPLASPTTTTTFQATATDLIGCSVTDSVTVNVHQPFGEESICMVSVDPASEKAQIIWQPTEEMGTAGYNIFRSTEPDIWNQEGYQPFDEAGSYIVEASEPQILQEKYSLSVVDTCGNESTKSVLHSPVLLQISQSGSEMELSWQHYMIGDETFIPEKYYIFRGAELADMQLYDSIAGTQNTFIDSNVQTHLYYRFAFDTQWNCSQSEATVYSYSNSVANDETTAILDVNHSATSISVFPNPVSGRATVTFSNPTNEKLYFQLVDEKGIVVREAKNISGTEFTFGKGELKQGVYFVLITGEQSQQVVKVVME